MWEKFHSTYFLSFTFSFLFIARLQHYNINWLPSQKKLILLWKFIKRENRQNNSWNITWKKSSVETPNHSGESKNWCWNTMCRALWFCDTTSLHTHISIWKEKNETKKEMVRDGRALKMPSITRNLRNKTINDWL